MERLARVVGHLVESGGLSATKVSSESKDHNSNDHNSKTVKESKDDNSKTDEIVTYELFKIAPRWLFLRIETRKGIVGWGEPSLEGWCDSVMTCVGEMMESIVGEDPARIQYIWQKIRRQKFYGGGPVIMTSLAGIDEALWDIKGKTLKAPVHQLLGGAVRDRLLVYRWFGGHRNDPQSAANEAKRVLHQSNYRLLKMNACPPMQFIDTDGKIEIARETMKAVREAVGPDIGIGVDFHGRVKPPMAKKLVKALSPFNPLFIEEAVHPDQNHYLKAIAANTHVPLATGERMYTLSAFRDLLETRAANIIQPDCSHVGGISGLFRIAVMGQAYDTALAPHCPLGPIALACCLQVDACAVNFAFQETSLGIHYNTEGGLTISSDKCALLRFVKNPQVFDVDKDGYMKIPKTPGLGVEIDEELVRKAAVLGHNWRGREWTLQDGTPTRW